MNCDLISRKELKEKIEHFKHTAYDENNELLFEYIELPTLFKIIANALAVEEVSVIEFKEPLPMVKAQKSVKALSKGPKGEWVVQRLQNGFDDVYCPFCNARPTKSEYGYYLKDKFCHECGADMRTGDAE